MATPKTQLHEQDSQYANKDSERAARWNRENKERRREIRLKWSRANADKKRAYYEAHKPEAKEYARKWAKENRATINEKNKLWQAANPDKVRAMSRAYYQNNRLKVADNTRKWRMANPVETQLMGHNRRAKMRGTIVKEDIINWESRICGICSELIDGGFHIDHIIPVSRGGLHEVANLQLAHPSCNGRKHNKLPSELLLQGAT